MSQNTEEPKGDEARQREPHEEKPVRADFIESVTLLYCAKHQIEYPKGERCPQC